MYLLAAARKVKIVYLLAAARKVKISSYRNLR